MVAQPPKLYVDVNRTTIVGVYSAVDLEHLLAKYLTNAPFVCVFGCWRGEPAQPVLSVIVSMTTPASISYRGCLGSPSRWPLKMDCRIVTAARGTTTLFLVVSSTKATTVLIVEEDTEKEGIGTSIMRWHAGRLETKYETYID